VPIAAKRKSKRLIGDCDPDEWDLPPKPKWMRWRTYHRYVDRFDRYEEILERVVALEPLKSVASRHASITSSPRDTIITIVRTG
jgi:hypothetical protein